jgi:hypothetical protein
VNRPTSSALAARLFGGRPERTLALVRAAWPLAVGPDLGRRTEVVGLENGTLRVRVPDRRWRKELHRMQPDLLRRLARLAGPLAPVRLGFVDGGMPDVPEPAAAEEAPSPALAGEVAASAETIGDEEIRARFLESATRYLGRGKGRRHG